MDLSFQLYSARNFPLPQVLKTIAGLGYKHVEGYGGLYTDVPGLKSQLEANGLTMPTAHIGLDQLEKADETLRLAETLGINTVVCPWLAPDQRPKDTAGWRALGERLAKFSEPYTRAGLSFGYHNHDFEFAPLADNRFPMDVLLEAAPGIACEADIAWIVRGKADPFPWLEKFGSRIVAVHLKDIAPAGQNTNEDGWADVGHGTMPWKDLINTVREKTSARYFVIEHDNPSDINRFATRSIESVRAFGA